MANGGPSTPRRSFVNWFLGTSAGALMASILYPVLRYVSPPDVPEATTQQVEAGLTNDPELLEEGFKIVRFGADPVILIKAAEGDYRAFSATCTHLDCIVEYHQDQQKIWCNCHNGEYSLTGEVVSGPPPHALEMFQVDLVTKTAGQPQIIVVSKA